MPLWDQVEARRRREVDLAADATNDEAMKPQANPMKISGANETPGLDEVAVIKAEFRRRRRLGSRRSRSGSFGKERFGPRHRSERRTPPAAVDQRGPLPWLI